MCTQPRDQNGTDLPVVGKTISKADYKVYFSENKLSVQQLNYLYNMSGRYNQHEYLMKDLDWELVNPLMGRNTNYR